ATSLWKSPDTEKSLSNKADMISPEKGIVVKIEVIAVKN
ncbi:hypothetical protein Tco_0632973, partial [Tanacetum coccineum]